MQIVLLLAGVSAASAGIVGCNDDNCARALTGTQAGATRAASRITTDCSSFQEATVFPTAVTVTVTSGTVSTTILPPTAGTTVIPTNVPAYAQTACASGNAVSSRFASACSCAGVTKATTTAPAPTATVVVPWQGCSNPGFGNTCPGLAADGQTCFCNPLTDGAAVCTEDYPCNGPVCSTDADCNGGACAATAPVCGQNVCIPAGNLAACINASSPSRLFRKDGSSGVNSDAIAKAGGAKL